MLHGVVVKLTPRQDHIALRVEHGEAALAVFTAHAVSIVVFHLEDVAPLFQAHGNRDHLPVLVVLVGASSVDHRAQPANFPRGLAAVIIEHEFQREVEGLLGKGGELHNGGVVEVVLVLGPIDGEDDHLHFRRAVLSEDGRKGQLGVLVLCEVAGPIHRLLGAAIHRVAQGRRREGVGSEIAEDQFKDHFSTAAKHPVGCLGDADAQVQGKRGHTAGIGVAVEDFRADAERIEELGDAVVEADAHAAVVVELAVVLVAAARGCTAIELADDAVVLVEEGRS